MLFSCWFSIMVCFFPFGFSFCLWDDFLQNKTFLFCLLFVFWRGFPFAFVWQLEGIMSQISNFNLWCEAFPNTEAVYICRVDIGEGWLWFWVLSDDFSSLFSIRFWDTQISLQASGVVDRGLFWVGCYTEGISLWSYNL